MNNMKNTWKKIKKMVILKTVSSMFFRALSVNDINTCGITNTLKNYFSSITTKHQLPS